jgi:hypothetical protein
MSKELKMLATMFKGLSGHGAINGHSANCVNLMHSRQKSTSNKSLAGFAKRFKIDKNMQLAVCNHGTDSKAVPMDVILPPPPTVAEISKGRPLVILLSWLMASEKHLEKYRSIYFKHGFDVLTVRTSPFEMLFPVYGSQKVAHNLFTFVKSKVATYPNILVHGFSVGAYQFSEMLVKLQDGLSRQEVDGSCEIVRKAIKGVIFDSAVDVDGAPYGISRSIAGETKLADGIEHLVRGHMKLFKNIATKHYEKSSKCFKNTPLRCPALLMVSREDRLGNPVANELTAARWRELGIDVTWQCWEKSRHVAHLHKYPDEYVGAIQRFLKKINLGKNLDGVAQPSLI